MKQDVFPKMKKKIFEILVICLLASLFTARVCAAETDNKNMDDGKTDNNCITIISQAEMLTDYKNGFIFEDINLSGAEYRISAEEDIADPADNDKVLFEKGNVVENLTTENGKVVSMYLPYGKYSVREISVPRGVYIEGEEVLVELKKDKKPDDVEFLHAKKTIQIEVGLENGGQESEVALYAADEIVDRDGNMLFDRNEEINRQKFVSGLATFTELPTTLYLKNEEVDMYYIKQTKAKSDAFLDEKRYPFSGESNGKAELNAISKKVIFSCQDEEKKDMSDVVLTIMQGAEVVATLDNIFETEDLLPGVTYTVSSTVPDGFITPVPVEFTVTEDAQEQTVSVNYIQTAINVSLLDGTDGSLIPNGELDITDDSGKTVNTIKTEKDAVVVKGLKIGTYLLRQSVANKGYATAEAIEFDVKDTSETQAVALTNERIKAYIEVELLSSVNRVPLSNAVFAFKDRNKKVVEKITTGNDGIAVMKERVDIGAYEQGVYKGPVKYYLKEITPPDGYHLDETEYEIKFDYLDADTPIVYQKLTIPNRSIIEEIPKSKSISKLTALSGVTNSGTRQATTVSAVQTRDNGVNTDQFIMLVISATFCSMSALYSLLKNNKNKAAN